MQEEIDRQIRHILQLGLIEIPERQWAKPIACESKKNGNIRLHVDYILLNKYTVTDAYPVQNSKDHLFEVGKVNYITVLYFTKGYKYF